MRFSGRQIDQEPRLITKNLRYRHIHTRLIILIKFIWEESRPFLDYPTLYPRGMPITLKWGILPCCGSPGHRAHTKSHTHCRSSEITCKIMAGLDTDENADFFSPDTVNFDRPVYILYSYFMQTRVDDSTCSLQTLLLILIYCGGIWPSNNLFIADHPAIIYCGVILQFHM